MFLEQAYTGNNKWYLYILSLLVVFVATQIGGIPLVIYLIASQPEALLTGDISTIMTSTNAALALTLLTFAVGFFALFLCVKYIHQKQYKDIVTARRKVDWNRIFFSAGIWALLSVVGVVITLLTTDTSQIVFQFEPSKFFVLLIISLALFPFQTSFEELVFRGYLMQWAAMLLKYRWAALLITGLLFGAMHAVNPEIKAYGIWVAMPQYILMGLLLGYVAIKDNGLELALGLHLANNILSAITLTSDASALQTHALFKNLNSTASHLDTLFIFVCGVIFIWACNRKYRFMGKVNLWEKITKPAYSEEKTENGL